MRQSDDHDIQKYVEYLEREGSGALPCSTSWERGDCGDYTNKEDVMKRLSKSPIIAVWRWMRCIVRHIKMLRNYAATNHALEAAWYAMEKHARKECRREISTATKALQKTGSLPND